MNKEIKDRLDKLENELKESKDEIHSLKSSVSLKIERGIGKLLSRFTRKQIILGSLIVLFSISIIGIAGTVTKTYTFSSGDVVSASKINTNFDTLYTLVNGNLDDNNISAISGSKITSGTVAAARIDNLSASIITSGTIDGERIDNVSFKAIKYDGIFVYGSNTYVDGDLGGRNGADSECAGDNVIPTFYNNCTNIRALISTSSTDEIRDMPSNYSVPENKPVFNTQGNYLADNFSKLISGEDLYTYILGHRGMSIGSINFHHGTSDGGALNVKNCNGFTSASSSDDSYYIKGNAMKWSGTDETYRNCAFEGYYIMCICY